MVEKAIIQREITLGAGKAETTLASKAISKKSYPISSLKERAVEIKRKLNGGRNTVRIQTPNKVMLYDLDGAPHKGIDTPHRQHKNLNIRPGDNKVFWNKDRSRDAVKSMDQHDLRLVRKFLQRFFSKKK